MPLTGLTFPHAAAWRRGLCLANILYTPMLNSTLDLAERRRGKANHPERSGTKTSRARRNPDEFEFPESRDLGRHRPVADGVVQFVPEPRHEPARQRDQLFR